MKKIIFFTLTLCFLLTNYSAMSSNAIEKKPIKISSSKQINKKPLKISKKPKPCPVLCCSLTSIDYEIIGEDMSGNTWVQVTYNFFCSYIDWTGLPCY